MKSQQQAQLKAKTPDMNDKETANLADGEDSRAMDDGASPRRCPEHPDQDTLVACISCGKLFCRICTPPKGAGQQCQSCFESSVAELTGKAERAAEGRWPFRHRRSKAADAGSKDLLSREGVARAGAEEATGGAEGGEAPAAGWSFAKTTSSISTWLRRHFPLVSKTDDRNEELLSLGAAWKPLLITALAGVAVWCTVVLVSGHRSIPLSITVGLLVALAVNIEYGMKSNWQVGVLAAETVLLTLILAELIIQVLYVTEVFTHIDAVGKAYRVEITKATFNRVYIGALVKRLLPVTLISFFVGWWPLPRRLEWRGFGLGEKEKSTQEPS